MPKQLLIVDDEKAITSALVILLGSVGYQTTVVHSGEDALRQVDLLTPDLILLDISLPGLDGYEVCRYVRQQARYIPILMLTAKDQSWEKVMALELGADVYMTKPFEPNELLAQIKALLRLAEQMDAHMDESGERPLICGPLLLYPQQHRTLLEGRAIELSPKEFELLHFFMQQPGWVFGRQTILRQVWGYGRGDDSRTVDTHVQRLRSKIEMNPAQPQLLQTVRGFGYRLVPPDG